MICGVFGLFSLLNRYTVMKKKGMRADTSPNPSPVPNPNPVSLRPRLSSEPEFSMVIVDKVDAFVEVVKVELVMSLVDSIEVVHVDLKVVRVEVVVTLVDSVEVAHVDVNFVKVEVVETLVDSVEVAHVDVKVDKVEGLVILVDDSVKDEVIIPRVVLPGTHLQTAK